MQDSSQNFFLPLNVFSSRTCLHHIGVSTLFSYKKQLLCTYNILCSAFTSYISCTSADIVLFIQHVHTRFQLSFSFVTCIDEQEFDYSRDAQLQLLMHT